MSAQNQNYNGSLYRITPQKGSQIRETEGFELTVGDTSNYIEVLTDYEYGSLILELNDEEVRELRETKNPIKELINLYYINPLDNAVSIEIGETKQFMSDHEKIKLVHLISVAHYNGDYYDDLYEQGLELQSRCYHIVGDLTIELVQRDETDW